MLKAILLAGTIAVAAPALAQDMPAQNGSAPTQQPTMPDAVGPVNPATAPQTAPDTSMAQPETAAPADQAAAEPAPAARQPASAQQVAQIVEQDFPTYDKDADGALKADEFGAWMVALRSASEPAFTGESAADKEWIGKAMAAADTDQSGSVNKAELTGFLAPQPS
jgi:hypothetical protein